MKLVEKYLNDSSKKNTRWKEAEPYIFKDGRSTLVYCRNLKHHMDVIEEAKSHILKSTPINISRFALWCLGTRWSEAEPYIMKDYKAIVHYAKYILEGSWKEAEYLIKKPNAICDYAGINNRRFIKHEKYLIKSNHAAYYAAYIMKSRFKKAEPHIMATPMIAVWYARYVIKGRWKKAEPYILKSSRATITYLNHVVKKRWKNAEPVLKTTKYWKSYLKKYRYIP
jgi:hypothetical protein